MQITEDIHMILDHLMMAVLYKTLAERPSEGLNLIFLLLNYIL